jgi:hypothetical protein
MEAGRERLSLAGTLQLEKPDDDDGLSDSLALVTVEVSSSTAREKRERERDRGEVSTKGSERQRTGLNFFNSERLVSVGD